MATKQELLQKLNDLTDALDAVPDEFKGDIQKEIDETQAEIDSLNMVSTPSPTPSPSPVQQMPQMGGASSPILNSIVSTMANMMTMAVGWGIYYPLQ